MLLPARAWVLLCLFFIVLQSALAQPVLTGEVVEVPVRLYGYATGPDGVPAQGALLLPAAADRAGEIFVTVNTQQGAQMCLLERDDLPENFRFVTGEAPSILVTVASASYPRPGTSTTLAGRLTFDRNAPADNQKLIRLVDINNQPVTSATITARHNLSFAQLAMSVPLRADGMVSIPYIPRKWQAYPPNFMGPVNLCDLEIDYGAGQRARVSLRPYSETTPTVVMLPWQDGPPSSGTLQYEVTAQGADGAAQKDFTLYLPYDDRPPANRPGIQWNDPAVIKPRTISPGPDGRVHFYLNVAMLGRAAQAGESITVRDTSQVLFPVTNATASAGKQNTITLPRRLTLDAVMLDPSGSPIDLFPPGTDAYKNVSIYRVDAAGKRGDQDNISISSKTTTGPQFTITGVPVPGRYALTFDDKNYGPVNVEETSPTKPLAFPQEIQDGLLRGTVMTETGEPLAGATALLLGGDVYQDRDKLFSLGENLPDKPHAEVLADIQTSHPEVLEFQITTATGTWAFPRTLRSKNGYVTLIICKAGRLGAYQQIVTSDREVPLSRDLQITTLTLPVTTMARGIVSAPGTIPDNDNPGQLTSLKPGAKYRVTFFDTRNWFNQFTNDFGPGWTYPSQGREFVFGQPFEFPVPVGTSYTLSARPADYKLRLSLHTWKEGPALPGQDVQVSSATLRALQPFTLRLRYADDTPAAGLHLSALYGTEDRTGGNAYSNMPATNERGEYLLYGDEGLAPALNVMRPYTPHQVYTDWTQQQAQFKIQKLDTSTSIPTLTLHLDKNFLKLGGQP